MFKLAPTQPVLLELLNPSEILHQVPSPLLPSLSWGVVAALAQVEELHHQPSRVLLLSRQRGLHSLSS